MEAQDALKPSGREHFNLLGLSNDLVALIVTFSSPSDLCSLARTCRLLNTYASELLYRSVTIKNRSAMSSFVQSHVTCSRVKQVHMLDLSLSLFWPEDEEETPAVYIIHELINLKQLRLTYTSVDEVMDGSWGYFEIPLPTTLAGSLTTCTINLEDFGQWHIHSCTPVFRHRSLKRLTLHRARWVRDRESPLTLGVGLNDTDLEELCLVDCTINARTLSRMLSFPRALKILAIVPTEDESFLYPTESITSEDFFEAISRSPASCSLQSLHFDICTYGFAVVTSPGIQNLVGLRYLQMGPFHLKKYDERIFGENPMPSWDCPVEHLLPPNLEVLKISPDAEASPKIFEALSRKPDLFPTWRKLIMNLNYRGRATSDLVYRSRLQQWVNDGRDPSMLYHNPEFSEE